MKKLLTFLGVAALFAATFTASAQTPTFYNNTALNSARFATGTTNLAAPIFIDVRKQGNVSLTATLRGATTPTNIMTFGWSDDGSTYQTNTPGIVTWVHDAPSALSQVNTTNIACGGHGYLVLFNVTATLINTNTLTYTTKISAP